MNNDLISRSELKKAIESYRYATDGVFEGISLIIDNAPTVSIDWGIDGGDRTVYASSQGEWIPASERLPDDMQRVLIWFEYYRYGDFNCMYQTYGFGYVCDGKWSPFINGETGWQDYNIIAWQPLPEPYMKGGEEE